jgi:MscS family membrane protein
MEAALADYMARPSFAGMTRMALLSDQLNLLLDLEPRAPSSRREVGIRTWTYLIDIFRRLPSIDPATLPDVDQMKDLGTDAFRIPNTPIYIAAITEGVQQGEYLFAASAVEVAPRFFRALRSEPLRSTLGIESFTGLGPQLTGPLVPPGIVDAVPEPLRTLWLDTPAWKVLAALVFVVALAGITVGIGRVQAAVRPALRMGRLVLQSILPVTLVLAATIALPFFAFQINVSGRFATITGTFQSALAHVGYAWLFWLGIRILFEWVILSPRIPDKSLDANMLRLLSSVLGILGVIVILALGGQAIGLPIMSILAGLGIGGLAVALAVRPTLENLVGGVMLYIDRPVRVGDFCSFGEWMGTVEGIGARSTTLRALDRTLISVPNAKFADMEIVNFAHCDQMLINETIGVRYQTSPDQLRFLLVGLRQMLHAHPRIAPDTVRVRFAGYADSALKIDVRVYVETREWNDFFAVREDVFLRIYDIVEESGTEFAFPSQTLYIGRDHDLDKDRVQAAEKAVQTWRAAGKLPFPRMTEDDIARLEGTLDYPPHGSNDKRGADATAEPLSTREDPSQELAPPETEKDQDRSGGRT